MSLRKVIISSGGKTIETELSIEELKFLLDSQQLAEQTKPITDQDHSKIFEEYKEKIRQEVEREELHKSRTVKSKSMSFIGLSPDKWKLLRKRPAEIRGRKEQDQSLYEIHQRRDSQFLLAVIKTKSNTSRVRLGDPNDSSSPISIIRRAVSAMPSEFKRSDLRSALPPNVGRGHILKSALEYLEHSHEVSKSKERTIGSGALIYKRITEKDSARDQSGRDATGTTLK